MKIHELLVSIRNKEFNLEKRLEVKKYLPIELKKTIAQGIIYDCTTEENGIIQVDSVQRYLSYVKYMITSHTNLEYTDDDYDVICSTEYGESTLLNEIVKLFQSDANECNRILDLMMDDYLDNNSAENHIAATIYNILNGIDKLSRSLADKVDGLNIKEMIPDNLDMKMLADFLNKN